MILLSDETAGKLLQDYDAVRQREVQLVTQLIDILPKIDNLDQRWLNQLRDAMFHADHPYMMVFVGPFNSGKSSLINAIVGRADLLRIGPTPLTEQVSILRYGEDAQPIEGMNRVQTVFSPSPLLKKVSFVDTPGLDSVFREHDETTEKFLHRADIILLVMLSTQAMTQSNLDTLQHFKQYGKKVIIVVNQCDLLSEEEVQEVQAYVTQQSHNKLGFTPDVWMVSARWGSQAQAVVPRDEVLWAKSNLGNVENYIEKQLGDSNRLRQKLQTPLQIAQNAHQAAVETVKTNQQTYDEYRLIGENISRQVEQQKADQLQAVRETNTQIEQRFTQTSDRAKAALQELFALGGVLKLTGRGLLEATFVGSLVRRGKPLGMVTQAFEQHKVQEPLAELRSLTDRLAPRLEGQDIKDMNDLAVYAQRESARMSDDMRGKMIGTVQVPASYDRSATLRLHETLEPIEQEANAGLMQRLEREQRNALIYLGLWQAICLILLVGLLRMWSVVANTNESPIEFVLLVMVLLASLTGFAAVPLRGQAIYTDYKRRLLALQARYLEVITKATDDQLATSLRLRQDTVRPLTQLIEAQASVQGKQLSLLQQTEQNVVKLEADVNALGKRRILGMTF